MKTVTQRISDALGKNPALSRALTAQTTLSRTGASRLFTSLDVPDFNGTGVDVLAGETKGAVFDPTLFSAPTEFANYSSQQEFTSIQSTEDYDRFTEYALSASFSGFGAKVSGTVQAISQIHLTEFSVALTYTKFVNTRALLWDKMSHSDMLKTASDTLAASIDDFVERYGYHFLSGILMGGYFIGYYNFTASTLEEFNSLKVDLQASVEAWGTSTEISASFLDVVKKLQSRYTVDARIINSGRSVSYDSSDAASMSKAFQQFMVDDQSIADHETVLSYVCQPWDDHPQIQDIMETNHKGQQITPNVGSDVMDYLSKRKGDLEELLSTVEEIKKTNTNLGPYYSEPLGRIQDALENVQNDLRSLTIPAVAALVPNNTSPFFQPINALLLNAGRALDIISVLGFNFSFSTNWDKSYTLPPTSPLGCSIIQNPTYQVGYTGQGTYWGPGTAVFAHAEKDGNKHLEFSISHEGLNVRLVAGTDSGSYHHEATASLDGLAAGTEQLTTAIDQYSWLSGQVWLQPLYK